MHNLGKLLVTVFCLLSLSGGTLLAHGDSHDSEVTTSDIHHAHVEPASSTEEWPGVILWAPPLHPLVVHFPIALLWAAAVLALFSVADPKRFASACHLLYAGSITALAALASGLYFEEYVPHQHGGSINDIMELHEDLGIAITISAWILSALSWHFTKTCGIRGRKWLTTGMVILALLVAFSSHLGGLLVHRFGVALGS